VKAGGLTGGDGGRGRGGSIGKRHVRAGGWRQRSEDMSVCMTRGYLQNSYWMQQYLLVDVLTVGIRVQFSPWWRPSSSGRPPLAARSPMKTSTPATTDCSPRGPHHHRPSIRTRFSQNFRISITWCGFESFDLRLAIAILRSIIDQCKPLPHPRGWVCTAGKGGRAGSAGAGDGWGGWELRGGERTAKGTAGEGEGGAAGGERSGRVRGRVPEGRGVVSLTVQSVGAALGPIQPRREVG